jgi:hypothetical protein
MQRDPIDGAIVARLPVIIKARPQEAGGRRLLEVQASCEAVDFDGDVILQEALLGSAASFVEKGHLDIDHLSEFGARLGIPNPSSYIVGRPLEVKGMANRQTWVLCEITKSLDGISDVVRNRYDEFWESFQRNPPVIWYSSVYGFPVDSLDCSSGYCEGHHATRYLIKSMDWTSLAFTRTPKNEALTGNARIVAAKAHLQELAKSFGVPISYPLTMSDVWSGGQCPTCEVQKAPSLFGYRHHFSICKAMSAGVADICAHAIMHRHNMHRALL